MKRSIKLRTVLWMLRRSLWTSYYKGKETLALRGYPNVTEGSLRRYVRGMGFHPSYKLVREAKSISMLHEEVLFLLRYFVLHSTGTVLEIGPYIGGSTVIMAVTAKELEKGPIYSIEVGGRHDHPQMPSANIFSSLKENIERFGVTDSVILMNGHSNEEKIKQEVHKIIPAGEISLFVVDADGEVGRDFELYKDLLHDGAILVFDDYSSQESSDSDRCLKSSLVKKWVDESICKRMVVSLGIWGWGTWIGMYKGRSC